MSLDIKKIVIIGCAGAGKTTLAKRLGARFDFPVYHLDYYYWKPGWVESDPELFKSTHQMLIAQPTWIIDGNQMITIEERIAVADMVVFLDMPTFLCLGRVLWRWIKNRFYNTQDSQSTMTWGLLCYAWRYNRAYRPIILDLISAARKKSNKIFIVVNTPETPGAIEKKIARFLE